MNRRDFIEQAAITGIITAAGVSEVVEAKVKWQVGCFNRPWTKWSFDETLDGVKAAGYQTTGLLSRTRSEPFIGSEATPEYLDNLKKKIAARGLKANLGALRSRHNIALDEATREVRKQIDHAQFLKLEYLLTFGVDKPEEYEHYFKVMSDAAAYADERGLKLVMKPHGGASGASDEIIRCIIAVCTWVRPYTTLLNLRKLGDISEPGRTQLPTAIRQSITRISKSGTTQATSFITLAGILSRNSNRLRSTSRASAPRIAAKSKAT